LAAVDAVVWRTFSTALFTGDEPLGLSLDVDELDDGVEFCMGRIPGRLWIGLRLYVAC
jgi:hypothetical protein